MRMWCLILVTLLRQVGPDRWKQRFVFGKSDFLECVFLFLCY